MHINEEFRRRLGEALNEAVLSGVEFNRKASEVGCTFDVIAMDKNGQVPEDNRFLFIFRPVGRFVASCRKGRWDDPDAKVGHFEPERILGVVRSFHGLPIYGWDFVNRGDKDFERWKDRLSFDYVAGRGVGLTNSIDLFQDGGDRFLDIRIWFDDLVILTPQYENVDLVEFLENGRRGWDAIFAGDEKMRNFGIFPMTPKGWRTRLRDLFRSKR